jgi:hypothetical protein
MKFQWNKRTAYLLCSVWSEEMCTHEYPLCCKRGQPVFHKIQSKLTVWNPLVNIFTSYPDVNNFQSYLSPYHVLVKKVAIKKVFLRVLLFYPVSIIGTMRHTFLLHIALTRTTNERSNITQDVRIRVRESNLVLSDRKQGLCRLSKQQPNFIMHLSVKQCFIL